MRRLAAVASLAILAAPITAAAKPLGAPGPLDQHYLTNAIEGDHFEIQGGALGVAKAQCPAVSRLAKRLKADHSKSLADTAKLAHTLTVSVPKSPSPSMQWELKQVGSMSGTAFDKAYVQLEVKDHIEDIQNTTEESSKGQTPAVRQAARKELPMLRVHLALAQTAARTC
jgi:putative membrane protein